MLSVVLSVFATVFNGMVWYSPHLGFGKIWAANAWPGKTLEQISAGSDNGATYLVAVIGHTALVLAYSFFMRRSPMRSLTEYIQLSLVASLLLFASRIVHLPFEPTPLVLILVDTGYDAANLMICSIITFCLATNRQ